MVMGMIVVAALLLGPSGDAGAQPPPPPASPAPEAPAAPAPPPPYDPGPPAPALGAGQATAAEGGATDHDSIVGRLGIEARRIGAFRRTQGQEADCTAPCMADLNALSLRRWTDHAYAYSFGLALGVGGGSSRPAPAADAQTWDTYFGVGPTLGASFLLASWKHLAVSWGPQLDAVFFLPSGKGSKNFLFNLRAVVEGELHLGMIGVPAASVALQTGLEARYHIATKDNKDGASGKDIMASRWSVGFTGNQSLWDLVTKMTLRYYF
jgi:hypothetical protein